MIYTHHKDKICYAHRCRLYRGGKFVLCPTCPTFVKGILWRFLIIVTLWSNIFLKAGPSFDFILCTHTSLWETWYPFLIFFHAVVHQEKQQCASKRRERKRQLANMNVKNSVSKIQNLSFQMFFWGKKCVQRVFSWTVKSYSKTQASNLSQERTQLLKVGKNLFSLVYWVLFTTFKRLFRPLLVPFN